MSTKVSPDFSVYNLVDWKNIYNIFTERRKLLAYWSKSIEEAFIAQQLHTNLYASFQQMRYIKPVLPRYRQMQPIAKRIYVFGVPGKNDPDLDDFHCVHLREDDSLTREWFLIVDEPPFTRALVAQEVTPMGTPHPDRLFRGLLTSERDQVRRLSDALAEAIS